MCHGAYAPVVFGHSHPDEAIIFCRWGRRSPLVRELGRSGSIGGCVCCWGGLAGSYVDSAGGKMRPYDIK